jgi:exoribonuclease-2
VRVDRCLRYEQCRSPQDLGLGDAAVGARLIELGEQLLRARQAAGAIQLDLDSLKISVRDGVVNFGLRRPRGPGDRLVAECMVLFNRHVGALLEAAGGAGIFRTQEEPRGALPPRDDPLFAVRARRLLSPARTMAEPGAHRGLGASAYAQATSPIRRYGDLVNQRLLASAVAGGPSPHSVAEVTRLAEHLTQRERDVRAASAAREGYWVARMLEPEVGETIHGLLSRPPRRGLGAVWVPSLCRDLPLRPPRGWDPPPAGTAMDWTIARVLPYRGRVELAPLP